ncbi:uncharacterized protein GGS22DRAFT_170304 [Annulohypoxylon maeteangense]|uniref:uncharacterized protein n=1 Tax=Annulohypoxylon maeteangense TaxID=1927788 RepID=UPI002007A890|nr:uncharacterized protein GGS22DRAFT_170304 [Annulohypoxylon maeteangense]KAI0882136.1 hypothetical protein GGS22DRAFT_170304 [Annulohypoxylon maeteangense]
MGMSRDSEHTAGSLSRQGSAASSPDGSEPKAANRSKANIRVSLACVQCRSKHVKCDATLPACNRCQQEDKPCFYAKSRRGIRDPKKRSLISDKPPATSAGSFLPTNFSSGSPSVQSLSLHDLPTGWSVNSAPSAASSSKNEKDLLIDLFYNHFHPSHPCLPPKRFFGNHVEADPDSYHFLLSVINFCGSLYSDSIPSDDLREAAFSAACASLPFTVQSVQGLLILSIAAFGEMKFEHHTGWANRAATIAVELGMNQKTFADRTTDSVLAESYRRTWWCLTFQDSTRHLGDVGSTLSITDVDSDVDLPCEEWEYDSGIIPQPISQSQYETQVNLGQSDFSSMAYLIDICKIQTDLVLPYHEAPENKKAEIFERADSRICDWLRRVPKWKMNLVDPDGVVDVVLYHGISIAHVNRLRLRQSAPRSGLNIREYFPLGPAKGPDRKGQMVKGFGWNSHPIDIQAANGYCDLFRHPFPTKTLRAVFAAGTLRVILAYLDACVFLGLDSPIFRERINRLTQILTVHGETWPLSRKIAEDVKAVAKEYLTPRISQSWRPGISESEAWTTVTSLHETPNLTPNFGFEPYQQVYQVEGWSMNDTWSANLTDIYQA